MKISHLIKAVIGLSALAATSGFAGQWDNPDTAGGILNDLDRPAYVGTSLSDTSKRMQIGSAPNPAFPNHDIDETGYVVGAAGPEKGSGEMYGSVLFDVGALR